MKEEEIDKFIKENVAFAISNFEADMLADKRIKTIIDFCAERKFNLKHPDFPKDLRDYLYDLMDRWPRLGLEEYCLITAFFTIREQPITKWEINPQGSGDEIPQGEIDLLNQIE